MKKWNTRGENLYGYYGEGGSIEVPSSFNGHDIKVIKPYAFSPLKKKIKDVTILSRINICNVSIANGYNSIGESAFELCKYLESVKLPESIRYIHQRAFARTAIRELYIPCGYTVVDDPDYKETFSECSELERIIVAEGVENLCDFMFMWCYSLSDVKLPATLKRIPTGLFAHCGKLTHIMLPGSISKIGNYAFMDTALENIEIPATVEEIGDHCFLRCKNLRTIKFAANSKLIRIGKGAFAGCTSVEELFFPCSVSDAGDGFFEGCEQLKAVVIPANVKLVYLSWFKGMKSIQKIIIKGDRTSILDRYHDWDYDDRDQSLQGFKNSTIVARKNSAAEHYALRVGINYEELVDTQKYL